MDWNAFLFPQSLLGSVKGYLKILNCNMVLNYTPNCLLIASCRLALVLVLLSMMGISWAVENPARSCILLHPWLQWALKTVRKTCGMVAFSADRNVSILVFLFKKWSLGSPVHDSFPSIQVRYGRLHFPCGTMVRPL